MTKRIAVLLVCISVIFSGCATTDFVNEDGSITRTRSIDIGAARSILMLALEAFDLVTARIALYEAEGESISEPDAIQLLLAEAREAFLRRGIDFLNEQFQQLEAGQREIRVPLGLMRSVEQSITTETGTPSMIMSRSVKIPRYGVSFSLATRPGPPAIVSPSDEPWRFGAAGFAPQT